MEKSTRSFPRGGLCLIRKALLIMKLSLVFLLIALQVSAVNHAQETINMKAESIDLKEVFKTIEKQTSYRFYYSEEDFGTYNPIFINAEKAGISEVLKKALKGTDIKWKIINKTKVVLYKNREQLLEQIMMTVKGVVSNEAGQPIEGASVIVKGSTTGTTTNAKGEFTLEVADGAILTVSAVGFMEQEITVDAEKLNIILKTTETKMDEVVVVGYGTQRRVSTTAAAATVDLSLINNRATSNLTNTLQGTVPGLTILGRPGDVGADVGTINVRGRGNLGTSSPLFVVDGTIIAAADFARIRPGDVENITVLKDAAAAIYGSRAAYGVILVTTKKGKGGKARVSYDFQYGKQVGTYLPAKLGSYDYALLANEAAANAGTAKPFTDENLQTIRDGSKPDLFPNNNWYDLVYRKSAPLSQHDLTISGGGNTKYFLGLGYMKQASLLPGKSLKRYNIRSNTSTKVSAIFDVGTNISFVHDDLENKKGTFSNTNLARMVPVMVAKQSDGSWGTINGGQVDATLGRDNPLRIMEEGGRSGLKLNRFIGSVNASLKPLKGWSIDGQLSYTFVNRDTSAVAAEMPPLVNFLTKNPIAGSGTQSNVFNMWQNEANIQAQLYSSYEKTIKEHYFKFMLGTSYEDYRRKFIQASRLDILSNNLDDINTGSVQDGKVFNAGRTEEWAFQSYFARLNYTLKDRYLLEGVLRADASSQFAADRRWGYYPSVSAAWRISKENFFETVRVINDLKLRLSYGQLGNVNNVGLYDYLDLLASGSAGVLGNGRVDGVWPAVIPNPAISWETVTSKNIGLDGALLNHRLNFQFDLFDKLTRDILLREPQPTEFGATTAQFPAINAARVRNRGFEAAINYGNNKSEGLNYSVGANITRIWNKILDLYNQPDQISGYFITRQGESVGSFYGYESMGLFTTNEEVKAHATQSNATKAGDIKYKDQNGDNVINASDRVIIGNDVPYFTYGINGSINYKGFDLSAMGQGVANVKVYLDAEASQAFFNGSGPKEYHLGRWTADNPNANAIYPRMLPTGPNAHNRVISDFWLYNASYFRIKYITLGYTLPQSVINRLKLNSVRFFVTANNYITFSGEKRMKDFDPETASQRATYPQIKTLAAGLNVNF